MDIFQATFLGILQGLTEFLPVSSSGHLVIFKNLIGVDFSYSLFFDVLLHFGTLLAIFYIYRDTLSDLVTFLFSDSFGLVKKNGFIDTFTKDQKGRFISLIFIASIPTGIIGLLYDKYFGDSFNDYRAAGIELVITGGILLLALIAKLRKNGILGITFIDALIIGIAQGIAIIPGISRSGLTIVAALLLGIDRKTSATFSFILVIPAIIGAMLLESSKFIQASDLNFSAIISGLLFSFISGLFALKILLKFVNQGKLYYFSIYCFIVGGLVILHSFQ